MSNRLRYWSVLSVLLIAGILGWFLARPSEIVNYDEAEERRLNSKTKEESSETQFKDKFFINKHQKSTLKEIDKFLDLHSRMSPSDLIAEFEFSGDVRLLELAQKKFPRDKSVIYASCMLAKDSKSKWLKVLEESEPDNPLPNIIRAGLGVLTKSEKDIADELQKAINKGRISTGAKERQAKLIDLIIQNGGQIPNRLNGDISASEIDQSFFLDLWALNKHLPKNKQLFGNEINSASMAVELAGKLRDLNEYGVRYSIVANEIEGGLLLHLHPSTKYGDEGMTVSQRFESLKTESIANYAKMGSLSKANRDSTVALQFLIRLRADGESSAMNWLSTHLK